MPNKTEYLASARGTCIRPYLELCGFWVDDALLHWSRSTVPTTVLSGTCIRPNSDTFELKTPCHTRVDQLYLRWCSPPGVYKAGDEHLEIATHVVCLVLYRSYTRQLFFGVCSGDRIPSRAVKLAKFLRHLVILRRQ